MVAAQTQVLFTFAMTTYIYVYTLALDCSIIIFIINFINSILLLLCSIMAFLHVLSFMYFVYD